MTEDQIENRIFDFVEKSGPVGWYAIVRFVGIFPGEFPEGKNEMSFVQLLVEKGRVIEIEQDGKVLYQVTPRRIEEA